MKQKFVCDCGIEYIPNAKYKDDRVKCDTCIKQTKSAQIKKKCIEYLGEKCVDCELQSEYVVIYDFDHIDPSKKSFKISGNAIFRWKEIQKELDKCVIRCSNCHRLRHYLIDLIKKDKTKIN